MSTGTSSPAATLAERLIDATNRHDLEALLECFGANFVNETPAHPARSFGGAAQVRRNWDQIFAAVPDLEAVPVRRAVIDDTAWIEWEMRGRRRDGSRHLMRGVTIFGVEDSSFGWVRFYLEPVEDGGAGIDQAVAAQVSR